MLNANCQIIKYIYIDVVFSSMVFAHAVKFVSATVDSRLKLSNSCFYFVSVRNLLPKNAATSADHEDSLFM